jgi:hypothetical protein
MGRAELLIAGLLVAVVGLSALARQLSVPYPIVLLGGALFGFVPGLPEVKLDPEVVMVVFLPPLLHASSIFELQRLPGQPARRHMSERRLPAAGEGDMIQVFTLEGHTT